MVNWLIKNRATYRGAKITILSTEVARIYRSVDDSRLLIALAHGRRQDGSGYADPTGRVKIPSVSVPIVVRDVNNMRYDLTTDPGEKAFTDKVNEAENESNTISARLHRSHNARADEGKYWTTYDPFEATRDYEVDEDTGQRFYTGDLNLDLERAELIRNAAKTILADVCMCPPDPDTGKKPHREHRVSPIVEQWARDGWTKRTGKPFVQHELIKLLTNPRLNNWRVHRVGNRDERAPRDSDQPSEQFPDTHSVPGTFGKELYPVLADDIFKPLCEVLEDSESA